MFRALRRRATTARHFPASPQHRAPSPPSPSRVTLSSLFTFSRPWLGKTCAFSSRCIPSSSRAPPSPHARALNPDPFSAPLPRSDHPAGAVTALRLAAQRCPQTFIPPATPGSVNHDVAPAYPVRRQDVKRAVNVCVVAQIAQISAVPARVLRGRRDVMTPERRIPAP